MVKVLILERLPEDNYLLLKYLVEFLSKVKLEIHFRSAVRNVQLFLRYLDFKGSRQEWPEQDDVFQFGCSVWPEFGVVAKSPDVADGHRPDQRFHRAHIISSPRDIHFVDKII